MSQSSVSPSVPQMKYAKFKVPGVAGTKHAVFHPSSTPFDEFQFQKVLEAVGWTAPNLIISPQNSAIHPRNLWTEAELQSPSLAKLRESGLEGATSEEVSNMMRDCLVSKLVSIMHAIMSAAEQTGSWTMHEGTASTADMLVSAIMRNGSVGTHIIVSMQGFPADDFCVQHPESWKIFQQLYKESVSLNHDNVALAQPIHLQSNWITDVVNFGLRSEWKHPHLYMDASKLKHFPVEERAPISQFPNVDATLFLIATPPEGVPSEIPQFKSCEGRFMNNCGDIYACANRLNNYGTVFLGGRADWLKEQFYSVCSGGYPCVIINHSGGFANSLAQAMLALEKIIRDRGNMFQKLSAKEELSADESLKHFSLEKRLGMVNAGLFLKHVNEAACREPGEKGMLTVAEIAAILDMAKVRPQYFTEAVKVVDPLIDSPEQCLERLSVCFSSTYTGTLELGASSTQEEVVLQAWRMHYQVEQQATSLRKCATIVTYACGLMSWVSIVISVFIGKLHECAEDKPDSVACRLAVIVCGDFDIVRARVIYLEWAMVFIPIASGLLATIGSHFMFLEKWGALRLRGSQLVREIYMYRANVGPYRLTNTNDDNEHISPASLKKVIRTKFMNSIFEIFSGALNSDLKDEVMVDPGGDMRDILTKYAMASLYGRKETQQCDWCCCRRRSRGYSDDSRQLAGSQSYDEYTSLVDDPSHLDDFVSTITAETYYNTRFELLNNMYKSRAPLISQRQQLGSIAIFLCSFGASMLGAFSQSGWIPIIVGFSTLLATMITYHGMRVELAASKVALSAFVRMQVVWSGSGNIDRRTPQFKDHLIMLIEDQVLAVEQAVVGAVAASTGRAEGNENERQGEEAKNTKKKEKKANKDM